MTPNLEELERLLAKATPGEWVAQGWGDGSTPDGVTNIFNHDAEVLLMECLPVDDAALIVALHNAAPSLIAKAREADELRAEVGRLRICVGLHVNADAYADTFPEDAEDAAQLRKSETWHRLSARSVLLERDKDVCNQAAKAWLLKPGGDPAAAFAAARAALGEAK